MTQHKPGTRSGGSPVTRSDGGVTGSMTPVWQIASDDIIIHRFGAPLRVRFKHTEGGIRGVVELTCDLPGPDGSRRQVMLTRHTRDRMVLAEDCNDEALAAWSGFLAGAA